MQKSLGHLRFENEHRDSSVEGSWGNWVWHGPGQLRSMRCTAVVSSTASSTLLEHFWNMRCSGTN